MQPLSQAGRRHALARMSRETLDLVIIGGGITGCGLAREAAMHGLTVALVEKEDFGAGTSSRSSKLVHGGLRYLAQADLRVVLESVRERRILQRVAPHLVRSLPFLYPLFGGESGFTTRIALRLMDLLARHGSRERFRGLSAEEVRLRAPGLRSDLSGGLLYQEFITDDARLTLENALSAAQRGALMANHTRVIGFVTEHGRVSGVRVRDELTGEVLTARGRVIVNATGVWADEVMKLAGARAPGHLLPSKGIHLLFDAARLPIEGAVVLRSPSGRQGFAIRRGGRVYVGTTDKAYDGPLDMPVADEAAVNELLALAQECFPALELTGADIVGTWAGLRPLVAQPGRRPRDTSRRDSVWRSQNGLITVAGGKLTTYRRMAQRLMVHVIRALGREVEYNPRATQAPLPGAAGEGPGQEAMLRSAGLSDETVSRLLWLYGTRARDVLRMGNEEPGGLDPLAPGLPAVRAEVRLAVEQEMALTLTDLLDRRLALLIFGPDGGEAAAEPASEIMASLLGWDEEERERQVAAYRDAVGRVTSLPFAYA